MRDSQIASDLSYEVFQLRRLRGELTPTVADSRALPLHLLPSRVSQRDGFIADRAAILDSDQGEVTPTWHVHGRRK
jgi:hypothetical protein